MTKNICLLSNLCDEKELSRFSIWHSTFSSWGKESVVLIMGLWPCESAADDLLNVSLQLTASGFAQYELFKSTALDGTVAASQTTITLDISWSPVDEILQTPPLSSTAALVGASPAFCWVYSLWVYFELASSWTALKGSAWSLASTASEGFARWSDPSVIYSAVIT